MAWGGYGGEREDMRPADVNVRCRDHGAARGAGHEGTAATLADLGRAAIRVRRRNEKDGLLRCGVLRLLCRSGVGAAFVRLCRGYGDPPEENDSQEADRSQHRQFRF
jgi:hypothetical protein